ncbi:MAG: YncE family protein [Aeromicrobium sp.]
MADTVVPGTTVSVIDTKALRVIRTISVGRGPHGVVASTDGQRVFVTNRFDDTVSEIAVPTQSVVRTSALATTHEATKRGGRFVLRREHGSAATCLTIDRAHIAP